MGPAERVVRDVVCSDWALTEIRVTRTLRPRAGMEKKWKVDERSIRWEQESKKGNK